MPDGPRYDDDFYAWTQYQAEVLRTMELTDERLDVENVAEEIECAGRRERNTALDHIRRVFENFLKLAYSSSADRERYAWMGDILEARFGLEDTLSPSVRTHAEPMLPQLYCTARKLAELSLLERGEKNPAARLPTECPYTFEQVLTRDWYPGAPE